MEGEFFWGKIIVAKFGEKEGGWCSKKVRGRMNGREEARLDHFLVYMNCSVMCYNAFA